MTKPERKFPERTSGILQANPEPLHIGGVSRDSQPEPEAAVQRPEKKAVTTQLSVDPLQEARALIKATYNDPEAYGSFNAFMDAALIAEVERARQKFNDGRPFPYKKNENVALRKGRPLGS